MKIDKLIKHMDEVFIKESKVSKWQQQVDVSYFRELRYLNGCFITRCFETKVEFARFIVSKDGYSIIVSNCYQNRSVNPTVKHTRWIYYSDIEKANCDYYHGPVNYDSLSKDIKGTIYRDCSFNKIIGTDNLGDMNYLLRNALRHPQVFIKLVKNQLYNLAVDSDLFTYSDDICTMLDVPNDYLSFIQKHNLYFEELQILKKLKRKNFKVIHQLNKYCR